MKRRALGRGLSALIPDQPQANPSDPARPDSGNGAAPLAAPTPAGSAARDFFHCPIAEIDPDRHQPRQAFDEAELAELVQSLREIGMVQPLVVRKQGDRYVLIAGERRWRAAQKAGLHRVPVVIREVDDLAAFEMALVENLQRADLNPIEEAEAYQRLIDDYGYTQTQLAERLGKDRATVANTLRLVKLPQSAQQALIARDISSGHGRALLALPSLDAMTRALREVLKRQLSVRETEALVKRTVRGLKDANATPNKPATQPSSNARDLQDRLTESLKTRVTLRQGRGHSGRIDIHYGSLDELDRLLQVLIP